MNKESAFIEIWYVLHSYCEAPLTCKDQLKSYFINNDSGEFRFQGNLGFGGKFYFDELGWRVGFYPEDHTQKRQDISNEVNAILDNKFEYHLVGYFKA